MKKLNMQTAIDFIEKHPVEAGSFVSVIMIVLSPIINHMLV